MDMKLYHSLSVAVNIFIIKAAFVTIKDMLLYNIELTI